jgi:hypothetical protein
METEMAIHFEVDIKGDTQKYAMSFLHIWNTARENSSTFYKVENCYDNRVYVTCNADDKDIVEDYLSQFGKILSSEEIKRVKIFPVFDNAKDYDNFYSDYSVQLVAMED